MSLPTFAECVHAAVDSRELVFQFNRLTGRRFGRSLERTNLEVMIDEATGAPIEDPEDVRAFIEFVREVVWAPLFERGEARP
jgi:hypothetical protein